MVAHDELNPKLCLSRKDLGIIGHSVCGWVKLGSQVIMSYPFSRKNYFIYNVFIYTIYFIGQGVVTYDL